MTEWVNTLGRKDNKMHGKYEVVQNALKFNIICLNCVYCLLRKQKLKFFYHNLQNVNVKTKIIIFFCHNLKNFTVEYETLFRCSL